MVPTHTADGAVTTIDAPPPGDRDDPVEVLLVEEISIDGMCGVY